MTKQTKITAVIDAEIQQWALGDTYVSKHNPRVVQDDDPTIAELAKTLVEKGLIQNLCGLLDEDGKKVGIVGGGRRRRALEIAVLDRPDLAIIPVKVTDDLETALSWAMLENTERQAMDKVDEIRAYGKNSEKGFNVTQIAKAYCVTEAHVRRRLKLAVLPAPVLDALKAGEVNLGQAQALTRSNDEAQILELLENAKNSHWFDENDIIDAIEGDTINADCRLMRFVGLDAYQKAGGTIKTDLFSKDEMKDAIVENVDLLERLFAEKLEDAADKLQSEINVAWVDMTSDTHIGYGFAESNGYAKMKPTEGVLTDEQQEQYDTIDDINSWERTDEQIAEIASLRDILVGDYTEEQRTLIGAVIYVDHAGDISNRVGFVKGDSYDAAVEAGYIKEAVAPEKKAAAPEFTKSFVEAMTARRLAAVQTALLEKPEFVLDLLAYGFSQKVGGYWNDINSISFSNERNKPSKEDDNFTLSPRLGGHVSDEELEAELNEEPPVYDTEWEGFEAFRSSGKKERNALITETFACSLKTQENDFMKMIEEECGANLRSIWTPTAENCFKGLNVGQLETLFKGLLELENDSVNFKTFVKCKKGEKAKLLEQLISDADTQKTLNVTPEQKANIDAWIPDCFN